MRWRRIFGRGVNCRGWMTKVCRIYLPVGDAQLRRWSISSPPSVLWWWGDSAVEPTSRPKLNQHKAPGPSHSARCLVFSTPIPTRFFRRPVLSHAHDTGEAVFSLQTHQPVPDCCADGARRRRVSLRLPPHVVYAGLRAPVLVAARHPRLFPCGTAAPDPADCPLLPRWPDIRHANGEETRRHAARRSSNQSGAWGPAQYFRPTSVGLLPVLTELGLTPWCLGRHTDLNRR